MRGEQKRALPAGDGKDRQRSKQMEKQVESRVCPKPVLATKIPGAAVKCLAIDSHSSCLSFWLRVTLAGYCPC